jgi:HK97 family phage portal protein
MWNANLAAYEGRELLVRRLDLTGNSFDRIERNARGQVVALWPMLDNVTVEKLANGRLRYKFYDGTRTEILLQEEVLHVRASTRNGYMGQSPIQVARGALALALSHEATAQSLSRNALRPSGLISYPGRLSREQVDDMRSKLEGGFAGAPNAGRVIIGEGGWKYDQMSWSPEDAEFLETRKLANEDVARIFGLPPTCVGITDKATYSNTEQEARALVQNAIGPLAARIETAMARCLLTDVGRRTLYIEHDLDGLLRGDVKSRFEAYRLAREISVFSPNDIRRLENEPPLGPEGDVYHMPANWVPLGTAPQAGPGE